jgi:poly-gamma-glutamate synthesis protein (capsule biosynthesis protein)
MAFGTFLVVVIIIMIVSVNINNDKTSIATADNESESVSSNEAEVNIYNDIVPEENQETETTEPVVPENKEMTLTILGEMMMGGDVTKNTSYLYNSAFKNIYSLTRHSDFTYANLSTNITNLETISDAKSKYLVTKDIKGAIMSLGIDAVSIASDHMLDYPNEIFNNTLSILEENSTYIAGLNSSILYLEKNTKKIAIIAANNVFIGTKKKYTDYGINVYSEEKMRNDIAIAKQNADFIIVDVHWGREYIYGVTAEMKKIAYSAIDNGADLVMGSHALGVYPIITYKNVPIIYSTGYIMTDSDSELSKQSYIFDLEISEENKIKSLEMFPIYIENKKEVVSLNEYNKEITAEFNNQLNTWNRQNNLNSNVVEDKIVITF